MSVLTVYVSRGSSPSVFSNHQLQRFLVQAQIRHQLVRPRFRVTKLSWLPGFAHLHQAVLRLSGIMCFDSHPPKPALGKMHHKTGSLSKPGAPLVGFL